MATPTRGSRGGGDQVSKSQERIYSAQQLVQALKSGLSAVKDQLQVLAILDGTAASWPGVNQAIDDMEFLVDMSSQTTHRLENDVLKAEAKAMDCKSEVATLRETLSLANTKCEELQNELAQTVKDNRQLTSKLDAASKEVSQQRQELWTLEKQRADLASEVEKTKQDNEFMEGEINTLRATVTEQMQQMTALKEELAARKSDAQHMKQSAADFKGQAMDLRKQLEATAANLRTVQSHLEHMRKEKQHYEKESERLAEEAARVGAELNKVSTEAQRQRDWGEVVKKVEADKLREEQQSHNRSRVEFEQGKTELEKTIARLTAELSNKEQLAFSKTAEASSSGKQVGLMNIQLRDLQKQLAVMQADKASIIKERELAKAEIGRLQAKLQQAATQAVHLEKEKAMAESRAREQAAADRGKMMAAFDEARKEGAVQKALADGWARDLRDLQGRLRAEQEKGTALREQLDAMQANSGSSEKQLEMIRNLATMEQVIKDLKSQINAKDLEVRRIKAESVSLQKQLEKQVERLQRECNESAIEIQRVRNGDATRLPPLAGRPQSLEDELAHLKRYVSHSVANGNAMAAERRPTAPSAPSIKSTPSIPPKQVSVLRHPTR